MIVESKFSPTWWLRNPHLQTILSSKVFRPPSVTTNCRRIELDDGDFIDINLSQQAAGDIVAIFHGLAGCVESSYIQGAIRTLEACTFCPVLMHWRGCSGEPNRLRRAYHSGASDDIRWFIGFLKDQFPGRPIHALGFSLGANALLKYLGESGRHSGLQSALAVSPPLVLQVGASKMSKGIARAYQHYLLKLLRSQHERKRIRYPQLQLPQASARLNDFWKFDDAITAPLHGFSDVHDYYNKCSARQYLRNIETRTHILCALDDPFYTPEILPDVHELSACTTLELSQYGGHVGFLSHRTGPNRWLDAHIARVFLQADVGCTATAAINRES